MEVHEQAIELTGNIFVGKYLGIRQYLSILWDYNELVFLIISLIKGNL